ncbi:DUF6115 domain-containing protein [Psychrobacillus vulpis]|uniref:Swarming motility protein SwrB n=1 Tax=Psychrobacillus vulpis TaxID=2325572 RepID=A0A544TU00_9BACI|nr:hypothetical protein [Psychrobacillus vulpis]TQR20947.1 hypothetical protein FG384_04960 [Psychrobacillus vulpis]
MTSIVLVILFLLQLISFYVIALLYSKLSKLNDIEKKQDQVLAEMEDSFVAYIAEIKDENNRLLQELRNTEKSIAASTVEIVPKATNEKEPFTFEQPKSYVSKVLAANSYLKSVASKEKKNPVTIQEKVLFYEEEGKSIDEIAKLLQIGKTEVELFLKFKN